MIDLAPFNKQPVDRPPKLKRGERREQRFAPAGMSPGYAATGMGPSRVVVPVRTGGTVLW